jgi:hypothetical protein
VAYVVLPFPVRSQDAAIALPALRLLLPTVSVAAKPYTAPKIVTARTTANNVRLFASAFVALIILNLLWSVSYRPDVGAR